MSHGPLQAPRKATAAATVNNLSDFINGSPFLFFTPNGAVRCGRFVGPRLIPRDCYLLRSVGELVVPVSSSDFRRLRRDRPIRKRIPSPAQANAENPSISSTSSRGLRLDRHRSSLISSTPL